VAQEGEPIIVKDTCDLGLPEWEDAVCTSGRIRRLPLYASTHTGERVWLELWEPGTENVVSQPAGGEEVFVISGLLVENSVVHPALTWIRNPLEGEGTRWTRSAPEGCKLLMKSGHLPMVSKLGEVPRPMPDAWPDAERRLGLRCPGLLRGHRHGDLPRARAPGCGDRAFLGGSRAGAVPWVAAAALAESPPEAVPVVLVEPDREERRALTEAHPP
jgi:hypothetical protein